MFFCQGLHQSHDLCSSCSRKDYLYAQVMRFDREAQTSAADQSVLARSGSLSFLLTDYRSDADSVVRTEDTFRYVGHRSVVVRASIAGRARQVVHVQRSHRRYRPGSAYF